MMTLMYVILTSCVFTVTMCAILITDRVLKRFDAPEPPVTELRRVKL